MAASSISMAAAASEAMIEVVMWCGREDGSKWQATCERDWRARRCFPRISHRGVTGAVLSLPLLLPYILMK